MSDLFGNHIINCWFSHEAAHLSRESVPNLDGLLSSIKTITLAKNGSIYHNKHNTAA